MDGAKATCSGCHKPGRTSATPVQTDRGPLWQVRQDVQKRANRKTAQDRRKEKLGGTAQMDQNPHVVTRPHAIQNHPVKGWIAVRVEVHVAFDVLSTNPGNAPCPIECS
jgi:hypothetical protein